MPPELDYFSFILGGLVTAASIFGVVQFLVWRDRGNPAERRLRELRPLPPTWPQRRHTR